MQSRHRTNVIKRIVKYVSHHNATPPLFIAALYVIAAALYFAAHIIR